MIYPTGYFKDIYLNKNEMKLIIDLGFKYKIKQAYHYLDKEPNYPYAFLENFFNLKESYKKKGQKDLSVIPKIIINGFYGKTIQINPNFEFSLKFQGEENLYDIIEYKDKKVYVYKNFKAGILFNPIVANEITANTRVQLYKSIKNKDKNIIGFQTDSIISEKKLNLKYGDKLGEWNIENEGETIILGSGIYQLIGESPKIRMRGFEKNLDLHTLLKKNKFKDKIDIDIMRNIKLKNVYRLKLDDKIKKELFNQILPDKRIIDINFDKKRVWNRKFINCEDVLRNQILSTPIQV
jgi:hypothetical protein